MWILFGAFFLVQSCRVEQKKAEALDRSLPSIARRCAEEIPWLFQVSRAKERSARTGKPILLYVRNVEWTAEFFAARDSLAAPSVPWDSDGLRKDVLFRAGPLSDPCISSLIQRRFVPVCVTYDFSSHGAGMIECAEWRRGSEGSAEYRVDHKIGRDGSGSLCIQGKPGGGLGYFVQTLYPMAKASPNMFRLCGYVRSEGFRGRGTAAKVSIVTMPEEGEQERFDTNAIRSNGEWAEIRVEFKPSKDIRGMSVMPMLVGEGSAWFDDLVLERIGTTDNLLANGAIDPDRGSRDPLTEIGLASRNIGTPALIVVDPAGKIVRKLHRIGALSADLIDRWLRRVLKENGVPSSATDPHELFLDGELESVLERSEDKLLRARALVRLGALDRAENELEGLTRPEVDVERGVIGLRRGNWLAAMQAFDRAQTFDHSRVEEAAFWAAWCRYVRGEQEEALRRWRRQAGESMFGKKSALCALSPEGGPWLVLSESVRRWPADESLSEQTEGGDAASFNPERSIEALLELQNADGSFSTHRGRRRSSESLDPFSGGITALAAEALWRWRGDVKGKMAGRVDEAHRRALNYLMTWAFRGGSDIAFNEPYVLMHLLRSGEQTGAQKVLDLLVQRQDPDGNWFRYEPERPASFNTALVLASLADAKRSGLEVPEQTVARGLRALAAMRVEEEGNRFTYSTAPGHEWLVEEHNSIARDSLCEYALLRWGKGDKTLLRSALTRFLKHHAGLREPTKREHDAFNTKGYGAYFFYFAHRHAVEAVSMLAEEEPAKAVRDAVKSAVLASMEGDGTFIDQFAYGRPYGTAMALIALILSRGTPK